MARAALDLEALLLPAACLGCGGYVDRVPRAVNRSVGRGGVLCGRCTLELRVVPAPRCGRCGQPLDQWASRSARRGADASSSRSSDHASWSTCGFCRDWPGSLAWTASAVWLEGPARELVHALKYGGWRVAAVPMAEALARHCGGLLHGVTLVPVPLGRTRLRARGHNQAEELALALGRRLGLAVACGVLMRRRETRSQTRLDPAARRANVRGAFTVGDRRPAAGDRVVLVDDVLTTGATLGAAAEALAAAGAAEIGAVTFARAGVPD